MMNDEPNVEQSLQKVTDEELERAWESVNCKTVNIYTYGMAGTGKSSLVRELLGPNARRKPKVQSGAKAVTLEKEEYEIPIGDVLVNVVDTPGMFVMDNEETDQKTVSDTAIVCQNDLEGVLLICVPMHGRIDRNTRDLMSRLNKATGKEIWQFGIIALTKADEYNEREWVDKTSSKTRQVLKQGFDKTLADAKEELKKIFLSIGLDDGEFSRIPILPTSQFTDNPDAILKMEKVIYESWFDMLVLECCKKDKGLGLLTIHKDRLSNLKPDILAAAGYPMEVAPRLTPLFRRHMEADVGYLALILQWKLYFKLIYSHQLVKPPAFQLAKYKH